MKKLLLFLCLIIIIPLIVINLAVKNNSNKFKSINNVFIRVKTNDNEIIKINIDDYLIGVLAGEMPLSFEKEALKAQAVASRSYVYNRLNVNKDYDVVDSINDQVYKDNEYLENVWKEDYNNNILLLKEVINETRNEYLCYNGEIVDAFFFSTSNGKTEDANDVFGFKKPYLESVESSWDKHSPKYNSKKTISLNEFLNKLKIDNFIINDILYNNTGSIKNIIIDNKIITGLNFRKIFNLNSTYFTIKNENEIITIDCKGYGHGVGMSQYGAQNMAKEGYKYDEILKHYYKNTEIVKK